MEGIGGNGSALKWFVLIAFFCFGEALFAKGSTKDSLKIEALLAVDSDEYTTISQRRKFYKKGAKLLEKYGYEIQWLKVAYKTVWSLQLAHSKITGALARSNAEIRQFISRGNKIILDDMLLKVREMWRDGEILKDNQALKWDAQILSDEQALIDPFYERLTSENQQILDENLKGWISRHILRNPRFKGFITNQEERWAFGMQKMGYDVTPAMMPAPNGNWRNVPLRVSRETKKMKEVESQN